MGHETSSSSLYNSFCTTSVGNSILGQDALMHERSLELQ